LLVRVVELPVIAAFLAWWPLQDLGVAFVRMVLAFWSTTQRPMRLVHVSQGRLRMGQPRCPAVSCARSRRL